LVALVTGVSSPLNTVIAPFTVQLMQSDPSPVAELSIGQQFEIERFSRAIDATADPDQLRSLAKQLLQAWHTQKAATQWVISQQL